MKMSGARIVLESLKREGVDVVFGLPGGAVLPLYDALYDFPGPLRHVLVRQEAAAGHAAEGYARVTGKVGVCLVTSGPAATNLVTALQDAYMDSMPIVAFTGQVPTHLIGNDAFQEADNVGITRPCTKHNYLVKDIKDIAPVIREAFHIAATGRPGPGAHRPAEGRPHEAGRLRVPRERPPPVVQPDVRGASRPGEEGGEGHDARPPRGAVRGRRGHRVGRVEGAPGARRADAHPGDDDPHGPGRLPVGPRPVAGHARHARRLRPQHGGLQLRLPDRGGRPVRRSRHGEGRPVRAAGGDHPHRRRPVLDLEEHQGARPDRGRRAPRPGAADRGRAPGGGRPGGLAGRGRRGSSGSASSASGSRSTRSATTGTTS